MLKKVVKGIWRRIHALFETSRNTWPIEKLKWRAMASYERICGYTFDLNNPVLFTEKLIWYKLFYENDDLKNIIDKYLFKQYIEKQLGKGYTLPLYGKYDTIDELKKAWDGLPQKFVLKSNVGSNGEMIKIVRDKNSVNSKALFKELKNWLKVKNTMINSYCRGYYDTTPCIIAEEYMEQIDNQLYDYKFFCFNGKPHCVHVAIDHFPGQLSKISYYDLNWNRIDVRYGVHPMNNVEKPKHFEAMLEIAKKLSVGFPFVRVDFFDTEEKLYLAEMTFYPGGGEFKFDPQSFNKELGDLFILPKKK